MSEVGGTMYNIKVITMGIMVCPNKNKLFFEKNYYKQLYRVGKENHIDVFVFYPHRIDWKAKKSTDFNIIPILTNLNQRSFPFHTLSMTDVFT